MSNNQCSAPKPSPPPTSSINHQTPPNCNCYPRKCFGKDCEQVIFYPNCQQWTYSITCQQVTIYNCGTMTVTGENNVNCSGSCTVNTIAGSVNGSCSGSACTTKLSSQGNCSQCYIQLYLCTLTITSPLVGENVETSSGTQEKTQSFSFQFLSLNDQSTNGNFPLFNCEGTFLVNDVVLFMALFTTYTNLSLQGTDIYKCKYKEKFYNTYTCNGQYFCQEAADVLRGEYLQVGNNETCFPQSTCQSNLPQLTKKCCCNPFVLAGSTPCGTCNSQQ